MAPPAGVPDDVCSSPEGGEEEGGGLSMGGPREAQEGGGLSERGGREEGRRRAGGPADSAAQLETLR